MRISDLLIDPVGWTPDDSRPLAFVDLAACRMEYCGPRPPVPVIGLGDREHPLAERLDAVVEPPVTAEDLIRQVAAAPRTAAALVLLLRAMEDVPPARALTFESQCYALLQGSAEHAAWLRAKRASPLPPGRILLARTDDTLDITLARPWARNAIDRPMRDALGEAFALATLDPNVRRVRLRGEGAAFSVGGDLAEFGTTRDPATAHLIRAATLPAAALLPVADRLEAIVRGPCIGAGLEIAAFAARVTARPGAWFQLPELAMGLVPGAGGCVSVSRRIGRQRAALMILSGRRVPAATALRWGLIDAIEDERAVDECG